MGRLTRNTNWMVAITLVGIVAYSDVAPGAEEPALDADELVLPAMPAQDPDPVDDILTAMARRAVPVRPATPPAPPEPAAPATDSRLPKPLQTPPPMRMSANDPNGLGPYILLGAALLALAIYLRSRKESRHSALPPDARVLSTTRVDSRRSVAVVELAGRYLVVGTSGRNMTILDTVTDPQEIARLRKQEQLGEEQPESDSQCLRNTQPLPASNTSSRLAQALAFTSGRSLKGSSRRLVEDYTAESGRRSSAGTRTSSPFKSVNPMSETAPVTSAGSVSAASSRRRPASLAEGVMRLHGRL